MHPVIITSQMVFGVRQLLVSGTSSKGVEVFTARTAITK
jgi:hypothetical protein